MRALGPLRRPQLRHPPQRRGGDGVGLAAADRDQFGDDGDGDFLRGDGADVEANRGMDGLEAVDRDGAILDEHVVDPLHLGAAADETEVAQVPRRERPQRVEIVSMAARDDDRVGR